MLAPSARESRHFVKDRRERVSARSWLPLFFFRTVFLIGTVLFGIGCRPTVTSLHDARTVGLRPPIMKMLVVAANMDPVDRFAVEDFLVVDLQKRGVAAGAAHAVFRGDPAAQADAYDVILAQGYEAVLRVELENIETQTFAAGEEDYTWTHVLIKTSLFEAATDALLWSASTRTTNPEDERDLAKSVSAVLLPALANAGFLLPLRASVPAKKK